MDLLEHVEDNHFIETVQEFRSEVLFGNLFDLGLHSFEISVAISHGIETKAGLTLDAVGTDIGSKDDDGITEVDFPTKTISHHSFL